MNEWKMRPIGYIRSPYSNTQQIPKGLGATHIMEGDLEVRPEFERGLQDIDGYSHLMILWVFHKAEGCELVGKAPTDGQPHGVFSTRSPRRPNPIGLTVVELVRREGAVLRLRGIDMLDGTTVLDIKPYTSSVPMEKLRRGWLEEAEKRRQKQEPGARSQKNLNGRRQICCFHGSR
jgi:tRNA (adenine37-N6)-methyltransferase